MRLPHHILFLICILFCANSFGQPTILDPCFSSGTPGTSFASVANLADVGSNADLCVWNGSAWTGGWPGASLTKVPPINSAGCRAIWCGSGTAWTTGGEGFGVRLSSGFVTGTVYSYSVTYVSHGTGSTGAFNPRVYTNAAGSLTGAYLIGNMPAVGTNWTTNILTFTATAAQNGHTWLIFGTWPNFSSGFVNSFCSTCSPVVLPIELLSFDAKPKDNGSVEIEWATFSETKNKSFILQRSKDADEFFDVTILKGAGNSEHTIHYSFTDKQPLKGISYYRLKIISTEGRISYSDLKSVSFTDPSSIVLYPNPAGSIINIPVKGNETIFTAENSKIEIEDHIGQTIFEVPYSNSLDVSILRSGYYHLKITSQDGRCYTYKFIKE
jgi:hypothetical protein